MLSLFALYSEYSFNLKVSLPTSKVTAMQSGFILGFLSVACFIAFIVLACCGVYFGGLTAWLFPTVGLAAALLLVCQGVANIHTNMIYKEVQNRPKYIVADEKNFE